MESGKKFDTGKLPWHLCPLSFVAPLVPIFQLGKDRYGFENWKRDFNAPDMTEDQRFVSAIKRHTEAIEEQGPLAINEQDGNVYHAAQIAWNALRLLWGALRRDCQLGSNSPPPQRMEVSRQDVRDGNYPKGARIWVEYP